MPNVDNVNNLASDDLVTAYAPLNLIKAGAGAGKTFHIQKTLTEWVKSGQVKADRILAVTFTNNAANELQERIRLALLTDGLYKESLLLQQSKISTIHGFGLELIERFSYETGSSPKPRQLTDSETEVLVSLSIAEVERIITILNDLSGWGYKGGYNGKEYTDAVDVFKSRVLSVIKQLVSIGSKSDASKILLLIEQAKVSIKQIYGDNLFKEETLNSSLWRSIEAIQGKYSQEELEEAWASNGATRGFIKSIFCATEKLISSDWSLWSDLKPIETAPKIFNKKTGDHVHEDAALAFSIWNAAEKISVHPGPLNQALEHIEILLESAFETLGHYQLKKNETGLVDFGDMVHLASLLMQDGRWLKEVKDCFDCIIIDEFQDTNPLQFSLRWAIAKAGIPALIVGDIKQSIMGFQGADSRLFSNLIANNKEHSSELDKNWRSTPELMGYINKVGLRLYGESYTPLTPKSDIQSSLDPVKVINFSDDNWSPQGAKGKSSILSDSNLVIVNEIKKILDSDLLITDKITGQVRAVRPNDIAVLGPTHSGLENFSSALRRFRIQSQIREKGWYESDSVSWALHALKCLADPRDQHSLLSLNLTLSKGASLESELKSYISQDKPRKVSGILVDKLNAIRKTNKHTTVVESIRSAIDALSLWDRFSKKSSDSDGQQQRANLLKLIKLGETFQDTQPETLQAQGIYGAGLSSFILWVEKNAEDFDTQPHVDNDNQHGVVLKTWHASKGLEWPIVIVLGMHETREPRLPNISVQYKEMTSVDSMLENAYTQIFTEFSDENISSKLIEALLPAEQETFRNLTYVVMTRAREQLILPWYNPGKDNCMIALLSLDDLEKDTIVEAVVPSSESELPSLEDSQIIFGRSAIDYKPLARAIPAQVSPSELSHHAQFKKEDINEKRTVEVFDYQSPMDLGLIESEHQASTIGTWVHLIYQVLLSNPDLEDRLFGQLEVFEKNDGLKKRVVQQVQDFSNMLHRDLAAISMQPELPLLAQTESMATISGIVDLLVEVEEGFWIIDHKTDGKSDEHQFNLHLPQLLAYASHLKLHKPIIGVAVNWVRSGILMKATL